MNTGANSGRDLPKNISRHRAGYRAQIEVGGRCYRKTSKDLESLTQWVTSKRNELHGAFANHN